MLHLHGVFLPGRLGLDTDWLWLNALEGRLCLCGLYGRYVRWSISAVYFSFVDARSTMAFTASS